MHSINRRFVLAGAGSAMFGAAIAPRLAFAQAPNNAPTPEQWASSPAIQHVALSPSGQHIAYIRDEGGTKILYDFDMGAKQSHTYNIGPAKVSDIFWLDDVHLLVATYAADKIEELAGALHTVSIATVFNLKTGKTNILFQNVAYTRGLSYGNVQRIIYKGEVQVTGATHDLKDGDDAKLLYRFSPDNDRPWLMDRGPWDTLKWLLTPQGDLVARSVFDRKTNTWSLDHYGGGAWKTIHSQPIGENWPSLGGLGRDGQSVVVYMPRRADTDEGGGYVEMSPDGRMTPILASTDGRSQPLYDATTGRLAGTCTYQDGWPTYTYDDPQMQALVTKAQGAVEGYRMLIDAQCDDPKKMILYSEGSDDAGSYYYVDFNTGQALQVGLKYPDIAPEWISSKTLITYKAADGLDIKAYLTLPPNRPAKGLPLVVLPHGGPEAADDIAFDWQVQVYASQGYAVLQPNFRGSSSESPAFVRAMYGEWGRKMQTDLSDGVRELVRQGVVAKGRVAIVGASYGGYAALAGAAFDHGVYNCAVDIAGLSDLPMFRESNYAKDGSETGPATRYWNRIWGKDTDLDAISPARNAAKVDIPVLIVHGQADTVVPYEHSQRMANALKAAGKPHEFVTFKGQDHWESDEASRVEMMKVVVAFLARYNPAA